MKDALKQLFLRLILAGSVVGVETSADSGDSGEEKILLAPKG
jgi:hypothetical protein